MWILKLIQDEKTASYFLKVRWYRPQNVDSDKKENKRFFVLKKDYQTWHKIKDEVNERPPMRRFQEREIWWCSLGANVGFEEDGKNSLFERPVLILRKFNSELFLGIPLTSRHKEGNKYYIKLKVGGIERSAIISQIRAFSSRRLLRKIERHGRDSFNDLVNNLSVMILEKTIPVDKSTGSPVPSGNLYSNIIKQKSQSQAKYTLNLMVERLKPEDVLESRLVINQSWLDTYVNKEHRVSREWIQEVNRHRILSGNIKSTQEGLSKNSSASWVAKDSKGKIVGVAVVFINERKEQNLRALYVDKGFHGKGVAGMLMESTMAWFDQDKPIYLGIAIYNDRARSFYKKWGFEEIEGSETKFLDRIPEVKMVKLNKKEE